MPGAVKNTDLLISRILKLRLKIGGHASTAAATPASATATATTIILSHTANLLLHLLNLDFKLNLACTHFLLPAEFNSGVRTHRFNDAFKVALPPAAAALLAAPPAWARYDDYKDGPRGLKYIVTEPGTGATPQRGQSVKAEYTLTLDGFSEDGGRVVDSSKGFLKGPFAFYAGTGGVIKGWDLMIMEMKEGEARKLIIPADLGYGSKGAGGKIPGGATLYFEVKLAALGDAPVLNEKQQQWLDEHPI